MNIPEEILELVDRYLDGSLDIPGREMLLRYLVQHPEAAAHLLDQLQMDTFLKELCQGRDFDLETVSAIRANSRTVRPPGPGAAPVVTTAKASCPVVVPTRAARVHARPIPTAALWLGLAACFVAVGGLVHFALLPRNQDPNSIVANPGPQAVILSGLANAEILRNGRQVPPPGDARLRPGDAIHATSGQVTVGFSGDASRIALQNGATISVPTAKEGEDRLDLVEGRIDARISPRGRPLILGTPHTRVSILGTAFSLEANGSRTRLEMLEGKVRLTSLSTQESIEVPAGVIATATTRQPFEVEVPAEILDVRIVETFGEETREVPLDGVAFYLARLDRKGNPDRSSVVIEEDLPAHDILEPEIEPDHGGFAFLLGSDRIKGHAHEIQGTRQSPSIHLALVARDAEIHTARFYLKTHATNPNAEFEMRFNGEPTVIQPGRGARHSVVEVRFRGRLPFSFNQMSFYRFNSYGIFGVTWE